MNKFFLAVVTFVVLSHQSYAKTKITQSDGVVQSIEVLKQYITQLHRMKKLRLSKLKIS